MPLKVGITGATGFVGRRLVRALVARGDEVTAFTRDPGRARRSLPAEVKLYTWNPTAGPPPVGALEGLDGVVSLAGETIGTPRWTEAQKRRIRDSRIVGTRNLVDGIAAAAARPKVLVSGSGVDYYGDSGDERLDESSPPGKGFLARVTVDWEAEADRATSLGVRVVLIRTSLVMGPNGGILQTLLPPFRLGLGTVVGSGPAVDALDSPRGRGRPDPARARAEGPLGPDQRGGAGTGDERRVHASAGEGSRSAGASLRAAIPGRAREWERRASCCWRASAPTRRGRSPPATGSSIRTWRERWRRA